MVAAGKFKATCLELMDRVCEKRVEYVITKHGRPVAKLVPCDEGALPDARGAMAGTIVIKGDIVSPDPESWGEYA
jgi:prevent-host-death family protein